MLRMIHISDLHFSKISFCLSQFFSKRWIGVMNLVFSRKKSFHPYPLWQLIDLFDKIQANYLIVTGDITSTSHREEFLSAKELFSAMEKHNLRLFYLPGNHDQYTKKDYHKRTFYKYFSNPFLHTEKAISHFQLRLHGVEAHYLQDKWWLVLMDTAKATSFFSSRGHFTPSIENNLLSLLSQIPKKDKIILANHFPFSQHESPRKILVRGKRLQEIIQNNSQIYFYLHGHTHAHSLANLQPNKLPIVLDSGSCAHNQIGSFNVITIDKEHTEIATYRWIKNTWQHSTTKEFPLLS